MGTEVVADVVVGLAVVVVVVVWSMSVGGRKVVGRNTSSR